MLINSAWAIQRFWKGCVGRWWRRGKWGRKVNERRCCLSYGIENFSPWFCLSQRNSFSPTLRKDGIFSMVPWLLRPDFSKKSPERSDFQGMRSVLLLKWDNAVHTAAEFGLLCFLNHRIWFPGLCYCSTWTDLEAAMSGYWFTLLLQSGLCLTHLQYLQRCLSAWGFHVHLSVNCAMPGGHQGESRPPLGRITLPGMHIGILDGEEIRPTHAYKISRVHGLSYSSQPESTCLPRAIHNSLTLGTAKSR